MWVNLSARALQKGYSQGRTEHDPADFFPRSFSRNQFSTGKENH
jgi:hypothetical protein